MVAWSVSSRDPQSVVKQAHSSSMQGIRKLYLTGIHTGGYGDDMENYGLAELLVGARQNRGIRPIRISSIEASQIDERC